MRWSIHIGTIAGIRLELHVTFLLFVVYVAVDRGLLTRNVAETLLEVALLLCIFSCVLLHELGHAFAARRYGIRTREIVLLPIGGVARLQRMPDQPQQEIVVALAGPAVNLVLIVVLGVVLGRHGVFAVGEEGLPLPPRLFSVHAVVLMFKRLLPYLFWVNVIMLGFNLIPAFPMDGGRVLRGVLAMRLPYVRATRWAAGIGQGLALVLGVVAYARFHNPMLMFVALFVFLAAGEERALVQARASMSGFPARAAMISEFEVLDVRDPLQRAIDLLMSGSQQDFPVLEAGAPIGMLSRSDLILALQRHGSDVPVGEVVRRDGQTAEPGEPLEEVLQRMREHQHNALPVVSAGRLVGLVTTENVSELMLVQDALRRHAGR